MRGRWVAGACVGIACLLGGPAHAGLADWNGHLAIGYAKLFTDAAPAGSISLGAGVERPITPELSLGADLGYHLLGSRTVVRGSLFANVDYSVFEAAALLTWRPPGLPLRLGAGPGLFSVHADLSTSGGGLAFTDLAVAETAGGVAANATWIARHPALLKVGLDVGARVAFLPDETWTLAVTRVSFHY